MQNRRPHPHGEKQDVCWWPPRFTDDPDHVKGFFSQFINDKWENGHCFLDGALRHAAKAMDHKISIGKTCDHYASCNLEADGQEYCPVCFHTEFMLLAREGLAYFQDFVRPLLREDTHNGVESDQVSEIRHLRAKVFELQEELQVKKMQLANIAEKYVKATDGMHITPEEQAAHIRRHGQPNFDTVKEKFDMLATAVEACINVATEVWNDHTVLKRALRREKARTSEAMKAYKNVTTKEEQGPLVNVLTNLLVEVQHMYATMTPMAAHHNDLYENDMVLVQKIDSEGLLERFMVDPDQKERMAFIRTEEYGSGAPNADGFIQVIGAFPEKINDLEVGLKCLEIAPSEKALGDFNAKLISGVKDDIRGTGSIETARTARRKARKEAEKAQNSPMPTNRPNLELFTPSYRSRQGDNAQPHGIQVVRQPPPTTGANAAPVNAPVKRYRTTACGVAGLDPDRHMNREVLQLSVTPRPMKTGLEAAKAVENVIHRVRAGEETVGNRTGNAQYAIFNEVLRLRGYSGDPYKTCEIAAQERARQQQVDRAQVAAQQVEREQDQDQEHQEHGQGGQEDVIQVDSD